jgi:hypothetical protein
MRANHHLLRDAVIPASKGAQLKLLWLASWFLEEAPACPTWEAHIPWHLSLTTETPAHARARAELQSAPMWERKLCSCAKAPHGP